LNSQTLQNFLKGWKYIDLAFRSYSCIYKYYASSMIGSQD
jgi:hypothetical protein